MATAALNELLSPFEPWQVAAGSAALALLLAHEVRWARGERRWRPRVQPFSRLFTFAEFEWKKAFFRAVRKLPFLEKLIEKEVGKMMSDTERELQEQMEGLEYTRRLPEKGWGKNRVIEEIKRMMQLGKRQGDRFPTAGHKPRRKSQSSSFMG